ncbi:MAG: hypothetical protein IPN29_21110 [Saprospiraceae bacterium]|nr:hypothetical protein [Saprospiraceae bacterium]
MIDTGFLLPLLLVFAAGQASLAFISGKPAQIKYGSVSSDQRHAFTGMMTVTVLKEDVDLCYQAGINAFIGKPFDTEDLLHKKNQLIKE